MSTRIERLANLVKEEVVVWRNPFTVKAGVGDSVDNNRVPSVRQTIRYLKGNFWLADAGQDLENVYGVLLKKNLFRKLRRRNARSDAYDINEFLRVVDKFVVKDDSLKAVLGRSINS